MKKLQKYIAKFEKDRGWFDAEPANLAKSVSIESAELLELFQWGNHSVVELKKNKEKLNDLKKELADVMIYCIHLGTLMDFELEKIIIDKMKYNEKKFPVGRVRDKDGEYLKIKKEYRKKGY